MRYHSRQNRLILICAVALCSLQQQDMSAIAVPQSPEYWRAQIQEANNADVKHDLTRAEALYKALLKRQMPLCNLMEVEARLAIMLLYQNRSAEANKYIDSILKQSENLTDKNSSVNAVLAVCLSDLAETLNFSIKSKESGVANVSRAVRLRRVFCNSNQAIIGDYRNLAHCQCSCDDYRAADATLTSLQKAYKEIDVKPPDLEERQRETTLIQALLENKIAHDRHMQKTIDNITAEMSRHMTKAALYCEIGYCNAYVYNIAEAKRYYQLSEKSIDPNTKLGKIEMQTLLGREAAIPLEEGDFNTAANLIKRRLVLLKELNTAPIEMERTYGSLALCYHCLHRTADEQAASRERAKAIAAKKKEVDWMIEDERSLELEEAKRKQQRQP